MQERNERAAERLWQAAQTGTPCEPVRDLIGADNIDAAYAVQKIISASREILGGRLVGRKIGLTSLAVQKQLGVNQPDFGMLFADMCLGDGEEVAEGRVMQAKVEAEIALVIDRPLTHEKHTVADIIRATAFALPSIEIVGSRIAKWDIKLGDTIADNASSGLFVLGSRPVKLDAFDIVGCGMVMERRGDQVSVGTGSACMGNPLLAAVWLADVMARYGQPLQPGDIVMTGALGPMVPAAASDIFDAHIQGLGRVRASFAPAQN
ncbi:2-keto-4-pentenoate hydratase [Polaromonas sp. JS666]|uniref:2-keto-4-pentenoate hydratase n=1 Tax=Polaromonas sp. (strain JS666 / ATCC BAA-500) TaxID=296591 RepID=UPI00005354C3|nr:fumarylacetoacetate hydrolase family protein [Polaromonas sp. JS666]ABE47001.1 Hydratase/decarboxylase [Polaromonas sp. JS666]